MEQLAIYAVIGMVAVFMMYSVFMAFAIGLTIYRSKQDK